MDDLDADDRVPVGPGPGDDVPSVARIYDYFLGGAHNFAPDRERAAEILAAFPTITTTAWANRYFLRYAVEHALDLGVRQFLDLGSGIPTVGNVHEIARRRDPSTRVAYVDHEPVAVAHSASLLEAVPNATISQADLRDPDAVLGAPGVADLLDLTEPVAVLAVAVLHFVSNRDDAAGVLARYRRALAPGSLLALTHASEDYPDHPEVAEAMARLARPYAGTSNPGQDRSRAEIRALAEDAGFRVNDDGLVDVSRWAPASHDGTPLGLYAVVTEPLAAP